LATNTKNQEGRSSKNGETKQPAKKITRGLKLGEMAVGGSTGGRKFVQSSGQLKRRLTKNTASMMGGDVKTRGKGPQVRKSVGKICRRRGGKKRNIPEVRGGVAKCGMT